MKKSSRLVVESPLLCRSTDDSYRFPWAPSSACQLRADNAFEVSHVVFFEIFLWYVFFDDASVCSNRHYHPTHLHLILSFISCRIIKFSTLLLVARAADEKWTSSMKTKVSRLTVAIFKRLVAWFIILSSLNGFDGGLFFFFQTIIFFLILLYILAI